jgi:hypothetical protein
MAHESLPLLTRIRYIVGIYRFKALVQLYLLIIKVFPRFRGKGPTYKKKYPALPGLVNHVFLPPDYKLGGKPLPLLVNHPIFPLYSILRLYLGLTFSD